MHTFGTVTIDNENREQYTGKMKVIRFSSDIEETDTVLRNISRCMNGESYRICGGYIDGDE